jgi:predicted nucleic acid-binding protein
LFVVALINPKDQYHERASMLAEEYDGYPLLTTDGVLLEVGNALARNFKNQAIEVINGFRISKEAEIIRLDAVLFDKAYQLYRQFKDKAWGLVDCISFVTMREANVEKALTFDQHFVQAGFVALMRD